MALRPAGHAGSYCRFFFQAEDCIRDTSVTGVQTCALPIYMEALASGSMCYAARMMRFLLPILALGNITAVAQTANQGTVQPTQTPTVNQAPRPVMAETPNTDLYYKLAPDAVVQEGVPKGEIRGPFTLPSQAYPGTQHTYWVYVPAQYDTATPASLMIYNDGQAFKAPEDDVRAP